MAPMSVSIPIAKKAMNVNKILKRREKEILFNFC